MPKWAGTPAFCVALTMIMYFFGGRGGCPHCRLLRSCVSVIVTGYGSVVAFYLQIERDVALSKHDIVTEDCQLRH